MRRRQTVQRRARFEVTGYSPDDMLQVGRLLSDDVRDRLLRAEDINDAPAPPLSNGKNGRGYAHDKGKRFPPAIRNWRRTGLTLGAMGVLDARRNRVVIGFQGVVANRRAYWNNRRWRMFGVSARNQGVLSTALRRVQVVKARRVA